VLLAAKFDLNVAAYNFIKPHSTLSKRFDKQSGKKCNIPTTPAMAAGLTSRPWTYSELLSTKGTN
jgi:hypothetical protein